MTRGSDGYLYGYAGNSIFRYDNTYPVPPNISIRVSPIVITAGKSTTLSWNATSADSCTASGDWSGAQAIRAFRRQPREPVPSRSAALGPAAMPR
jgi:hypothetical protein